MVLRFIDVSERIEKLKGIIKELEGEKLKLHGALRVFEELAEVGVDRIDTPGAKEPESEIHYHTFDELSDDTKTHE